MSGESIGSLMRWVFIAAFAKPILRWMSDEITFWGMLKGLCIVAFWRAVVMLVLFAMTMGLGLLASRSNPKDQVSKNVPAFSASDASLTAPPIAKLQPISQFARHNKEDGSVTQPNCGMSEHMPNDNQRMLPTASNAGFSCERASSHNEKLFCEYPLFSNLTHVLNALYQQKKIQA